MVGFVRHAVGGVVTLVCLAVVANCVFSGLVIDGRGGPSLQCLRATSTSEYAGPPVTEATQYDGEWTLVPIGLRCTVYVPTADGSPYMQWFQDWPATYAAWVALAVGAVGLLLLIVPGKGELRRLERWLDQLAP